MMFSTDLLALSGAEGLTLSEVEMLEIAHQETNSEIRSYTVIAVIH